MEKESKEILFDELIKNKKERRMLDLLSNYSDYTNDQILEILIEEEEK